MNLYRYCGNSPANFTDPSGMRAEPEGPARIPGHSHVPARPRPHPDPLLSARRGEFRSGFEGGIPVYDNPSQSPPPIPHRYNQVRLRDGRMCYSSGGGWCIFRVMKPDAAWNNSRDDDFGWWNVPANMFYGVAKPLISLSGLDIEDERRRKERRIQGVLDGTDNGKTGTPYRRIMQTRCGRGHSGRHSDSWYGDDRCNSNRLDRCYNDGWRDKRHYHP